MKGLLMKDLMLMKNQGRYFLTVTLIACAISFLGSDGFSIFCCSYVTFLFAYFTHSTIGYDEFDNGMGFLMALPVDRRTYVKEKYLFGILTTLAAWTASSLACVASGLTSGAQRDLPSTLVGLVSILCVVLAFLSASLFLGLKYGSEKGRSVLFGVIGAAVACMFLSYKFFPDLGHDLSLLLEQAAEGSSLLLSMGCLAIGLLLAVLPYLASLSVIERREF